jgi:hypothetical protein
VLLAAQVHDDARETQAIGRIAEAGCADDAECATNFTWIASIEENRRNSLHALALYKQAYQHAPEDDRILHAIARVASAAGLHAESAQAYERLSARQPSEERWRKAVRAERGEALKSAVAP